jgi:hypothetical protein
MRVSPAAAHAFLDVDAALHHEFEAIPIQGSSDKHDNNPAKVEIPHRTF